MLGFEDHRYNVRHIPHFAGRPQNRGEHSSATTSFGKRGNAHVAMLGVLRYRPEDGVQFLGSMCKWLLQRHGFSVSYRWFEFPVCHLHSIAHATNHQSRNIKGFMIQGGDPTGTGKGGESIWGGKFQDEFHHDNTHDKRGQVSMVSSSVCCQCCAVFTCPHAPHA